MKRLSFCTLDLLAFLSWLNWIYMHGFVSPFCSIGQQVYVDFCLLVGLLVLFFCSYYDILINGALYYILKSYHVKHLTPFLLLRLPSVIKVVFNVMKLLLSVVLNLWLSLSRINSLILLILSMKTGYLLVLLSLISSIICICKVIFIPVWLSWCLWGNLLSFLYFLLLHRILTYWFDFCAIIEFVYSNRPLISF